MIQILFRNVKVTPGLDVEAVMEISSDGSDYLEVFSDRGEGVRLYWTLLDGPTLTRPFRMNMYTNRPVFQFKQSGRVVARAQIDFQPGSARILGMYEGDITVRSW